MMKRFLTVIFVCILLYTSVSGQQNHERDSLLNLLPAAKKDSNLIQLYYDIGFQYELNDVKTAVEYYQKGKKLSEEIGWKKGLVKYAFNYTHILNMKGDFDESLILNKESIRLSEKLKDNILLTKSNVNTGNVFIQRNQYDSAVYYYETAKNYAVGDAFLSARISDLMTNVYRDMGRHKEAVQEGEAALKYFRKSDDSVSLSMILYNLGISYMEIDIAKAQQLLTESLQISRKIRYDQLRLRILTALIGPYFKNNKSIDPIVLKYAEEALPIAKSLHDNAGVAIAYRVLSIHYLFKRDYQKSHQYIDSSLAVLKTKDFPSEKQKTLYYKGLLLYSMGKLEAGNTLMYQSAALEDSIINNETREQVLTIEKRFETEKKENQIKLQEAKLKQKNLFNSILIGSTLSLILIIVLLYRNYRHRQNIQKAKIEELETEKQLLAVQSLLKGQEDERSRLAKDLHDGLGGMLSGVKLQLGAMKGNLILTEDNVALFNNALNKLDQSISEMRRVAHNMMPEALLKLGLEHALQDYCTSISASGKFSIDTEFYGLEQRLDSATEVTVYRIVQELVNNAVKHSHARTILVQVLRRDNTLSITVEDNGKGFDTSQWKDKLTAGLRNIQTRVNYLAGSFDIKSTPGEGTSVYIECTIENNG